MASESDNQRITLAEVERLLASAERSGTSIPSWLDRLASDLRAAMPPRDPEAPAMAYRMLADPRLSLGAQANIGAHTLRSLKS